MEILRIIVMLMGLLCFLCICFYWAFNKHTKARFEEAAQLPLADDDLPACPADRKE